jgi:probable HAF family extracellular repeat protein
MTRRGTTLLLEALEDRLVLSTIIDLGVRLGDMSSAATGINASGQVVGYSESSNGDFHAFLYSNGQMTDLGVLPGGTSSFATGINASGQVVGYSESSNGDNHAFLYSNGQMTDLGTLTGAKNSVAHGINASGQVVGVSGTHAFLYSNGQMTDLGTLTGTLTSSASGINASGQVVGNSGSDAVLYSNGQITDLSLGTAPGGLGSIGLSINAFGQVVGESIDINAVIHPFLYSNGQMTDLNTILPANSGWKLTRMTAINDSNQIVGAGIINGQSRAFLLNLDSPPRITGNPSDQSVTAGETATFTAAVGGNPTPTVQWQVSSDRGITFTNLSGATGTTLTLSNIQASQNGDRYRAVFTNSSGTAITSNATLTVNQSPPTPPARPSQASAPPLNVPPLLAFFNSILGGIETVNGDGTETMTDSLFGIPLLMSTFDSAGRLMSVTLFGFGITFLFELPDTAEQT